jgi:hypothetical protein
MFLLPGYAIVMHITQTPVPDATRLEILRYLTNLQTPEGGWGIHIESLPTVFGTALNYVVMRLLGVPREDPRMKRAREWLNPRGGRIEPCAHTHTRASTPPLAFIERLRIPLVWPSHPATCLVKTRVCGTFLRATCCQGCNSSHRLVMPSRSPPPQRYPDVPLMPHHDDHYIALSCPHDHHHHHNDVLMPPRSPPPPQRCPDALTITTTTTTMSQCPTTT